MENDRRVFLKRMMSACVLLGGSGLALIGCGSSEKGQSGGDAAASADAGGAADGEATSRFGGNCDDFSKLTDADWEVRERLGYEKVSPTAETECHTCNLWLPPRPNESCGGCTLFTGPIEPKGTCTYWAPRLS